jgi:hypothetical protein
MQDHETTNEGAIQLALSIASHDNCCPVEKRRKTIPPKLAEPSDVHMGTLHTFFQLHHEGTELCLQRWQILLDHITGSNPFSLGLLDPERLVGWLQDFH